MTGKGTYFEVSIALMIPAGSALSRGEFSNLSAAVERMMLHAQSLWKSYAMGAPLPDGNRVSPRTGAYAKSIISAMTGDFSGEVSSDLPYARVVEDGAPARDMKRMLDSSIKVRLSKKGKRYLIIPFRHGTPGTVGMGTPMPEAVHDIVSGAGFTPSRVTGMGTRASGTGAWDIKTRAPMQVPQRRYLWGDRLKIDQIHSAGVTGQTAQRMAGMVKFQNSGGKGGGKHTQYLKFRVMTEDSPGWLVPAQPGKHVAKQVADEIRPMAGAMFAEAVRRDIQAKLAGG